MHWIYLSPHFDDAVYSCGGLIWQQTRRGDTAEIWTICAGEPPDGPLSPFAQELHQRWETPQDSVTSRRAEDQQASQIVGATTRYLPIPDCIYRRPGLDYWSPPATRTAEMGDEAAIMYPDREALFGPLHPLEARLPWQLAQRLTEMLSADFGWAAGVRLAAPITLGGHADHRLTRLAAERLLTMEGLWYYADYPYAADHPGEIEALLPAGYSKHAIDLEPAAVEAWAAGMAAYASQISTFWSGVDDLRARLEAYLQRLGGGALWGPP
jgi:LmbE family N-acetylglucosaminyl deacetylase